MTTQQDKMRAEFLILIETKDKENLWTAEEFFAFAETSREEINKFIKNSHDILNGKNESASNFVTQFIKPYCASEAEKCLTAGKRAYKRKKFVGKIKRLRESLKIKSVAIKALKRKTASEAAREESLRRQNEEKERLFLIEQTRIRQEQIDAKRKEDEIKARKKERILTAIRISNILFLCLLLGGICAVTAYITKAISHCDGAKFAVVIIFNEIIAVLFGLRPVLPLFRSSDYDGWNWQCIILFLFFQVISVATITVHSLLAWLLSCIYGNTGVIVNYILLCLGIIVPYILAELGVFDSDEFITSPIETWRDGGAWGSIGTVLIVWICVFGALFIFLRILAYVWD